MGVLRPLWLALSLFVGVSVGGILEGMSASTADCNEKCANTYNQHTNQGFTSQLKSCQTGCRLLSIIESVDSDPFSSFGGSGLFGQNRAENDEQKMNKALKSCNDSCVNSFTSEGEISSCEAGCKFQVPAVKARKEQVSSPFGSFFGSSTPLMMRTSFPRLMIRIPLGPAHSTRQNEMAKPKETPKSIFGEPHASEEQQSTDFEDGIGGMFSHMRSMMHNMMSSLPSFGDMENLPEGSHGRMVVVKSGPGYHTEKTYNINPDGTKTEVVSNGNRQEISTSNKKEEENAELKSIQEEIKKDIEKDMKMQNDMMNKMNPLDSFLSDHLDNEVEILKPKSRDRVLDEHRESNSVHGYDFEDFEKPRMSEGLRPRYFNEATWHRIRMCSNENAKNLKWSDWVSCLHARMGLPRWLSAATISLAIIFVIWLCLVIPQNAPKQKVKMTKAMEAAQSLAVASRDAKMEKCLEGNNYLPPPTYKMDSPPAYDDIANLHVVIPGESVVSTAEKSAEEKKKSEEEEPKV